jgi:hypothetical protein
MTMRQLRIHVSRSLNATMQMMRALGLPLGANDVALKKLKNKHCGKRIFIVGSGPSLRVDLLDSLTTEVSFGMNQIYKVFPYTDWRPSYVVISDSLVAENFGNELLDKYDGTILASAHLTSILGLSPRIIYFRKTHEIYSNEFPDFSTNALLRVVGGFTSAYLCYQLAWYFGARVLYTLGIDASYQYETAKTGGWLGEWEIVSGGSPTNYAIPNYLAGKPQLKGSVKHMLLAHEAANDFFNRNGGKIFNVGENSPLDVFPKVPFWDLFFPDDPG